MRVITIDDRNIKDVYGRLRKFFYNKNSTGFEEWHNFDCGFKKHISPIIEVNGDRFRNVHLYPQPVDVKFNHDSGRNWIVLRLTATDAASIECGDKIAFLGGRIIIREKSFIPPHQYMYTVYQAAKMSKKEQEDAHRWAEIEEEAYEAYMMRDYEEGLW